MHAIIVAAWKAMPKAGSIGVVYLPRSDEFQISAALEGKRAWYFVKRLVYVSDPQRALDEACYYIAKVIGLKE